jgi:peptidoglycan/LPS O-acetylase OafA/YrhL
MTELHTSDLTTNRLKFLDALRGGAALYTVIFHLALVPNPRLIIPDWFLPFAYFGYSGVILFFVISGFSLFLTMPRHMQTAAPQLNYYISRFFRIAPLFYILIFISICRDIYFYSFYHSSSEIFLNIIFAFNFMPHQWISIVSAGWTVGVEMIFYLIFPILFYRIKTYNQLLLSIIFAILFGTIFASIVQIFVTDFSGFPGRDDYVRGNFFSHLPAFLIGMATCRIYQDDLLRWRGKDWRLWAGVLGGIGLLESMIKGGPGGGYLSAVDNSFQLALFYSLVILGCSSLDFSSLLGKVAQFFGKVSYSFYLWHYTIISLMNPIYQKISAFSASPLILFAICLIVTLIIVIPLSWASFYYIETPFIKLGEKLKRK